MFWFFACIFSALFHWSVHFLGWPIRVLLLGRFVSFIGWPGCQSKCELVWQGPMCNGVIFTEGFYRGAWLMKIPANFVVNNDRLFDMKLQF